MRVRPARIQLRDLLLWLPVIPALGVGLAAIVMGVHRRDVDGITLGFLMLGPWSAAAGLFSGRVLLRQPMGRAFAQLAGLLVAGPLAVALLTGAVSTPLYFLLRFRDASAGQVVLVVLTCWYLVSAATGVELLDRQLKRTP
jgi:hypothetical protein